ncbi:MAG TPA: GAF domain-containing protein [Anaerolineales bacterium]|nr:GAF domain-containing protein [Anaerolineales bacterium]
MADSRSRPHDLAGQAGSRAGRRRRGPDPQAILRAGVVYGLFTLLAAGAYVLLVWGLNLLTAAAIRADDPFLIGAMVALLAAIFHPLRAALQRGIDATFFRRRAGFETDLKAFGQDLTQAAGLGEILQRVSRCLKTALDPARLDIFLLDPSTDQFAAVAPDGGAPATDLRFARNGPLAGYLAKTGVSVTIKDGDLPAALLPERARLALLGSSLFIPLSGQRGLAGWLALSGRSQGVPYDRAELAFLEALAGQTALAVERARIVADLQRRVHEMNVLGRVAQGINVTLNFDDILELIYAQTVLIAPAVHFRITLYDDVAGAFRHAFLLDGDDRLVDLENRALPEGQGLEQVVVRSGRAINTSDHESECRRRGVIPPLRGLYAWLGVPLNAGERTIGALCLGSTNPAVVYTAEQQNIIQSIADQATGAIVKTRLLEESERRARQLEGLNQVARSLTLELEIEPLLNRVIESAVEIFDCEAGTLFLIDEDTGEIVFSVVVGGAKDLVGTRLAPGTGLVGKSIDTRLPIIQNNVHQSADWFGQTDESTGFTTRGLLVVPMQVREDIIGVIEIINKRDHSPFTTDDERLLTAFAAQAAIAVQNARLFTMTDQALASRVEELSVMQRIDRELNASLDLDRAMHITLDWALRQSGAEAGLIAAIDDSGLALIDAIGYPFDHKEDGVTERVAGLKIIREALDRPRPPDLPGGDAPAGLLPEAVTGIAVPILRNLRPIGLILLESKAPGLFTGEVSAFLDRLGDHAAIAIANARFYSEVQEANIAKSDFISFVSHELKTPMTSIKGYADLLSAGAVGEVNEAQAGFLTTIRSNVDRMATLVSDLADVSRIEAGRLRLDYGSVRVQEVVDEVVRSASRQIEEKKQALAVRIPEDLPAVWGDRTRLVQVLANLLSNAVKYTEAGGELTVAAEVIGAAGEIVRIDVSDNGIGINPEDQGQIFTKFFRSEDQKAREVTGTGLGLNITKNLVEMQGGAIWFESEYRRGTRFYFTIPVAESG